MIQKPNSLELMDAIDETVQNVRDIKNDLASLESQMDVKLNILNSYFQIALDKLADFNEIEEKTRDIDTFVFSLDKAKIAGGVYSSYGQTIHPKLAGLSDQMFNFLTNSGPVFKDNVTVTFLYDKTNTDGTIENVTDYKYEYCNVLKHESDPSKKDVFQTFAQDQITMRVEMKPSNLIGNTQCNLIEICPYLPGTFRIDQVRIWTIEQYLSQDLDIPTVPNVTYENVGQERILLNDTYQIYRIEFDITITEEKNGFPFGLRHLYFYNAQMDTENSYVIVEIKKDSYIESVGENVVVVTPEGRTTYGADVYGIEYYAIYENNVLQGQLLPNTPLARNLTSVYAKIPVREPLKAVIFKDIYTR